MSLVLLLCDALLLPISIAWDWRLGLDNAASTLLFCSIWSSLVFWTLDVLVNLNTAVYIKGLLVHRREAILSRYMRSWLLLDISLVSLDYLNVAQAGKQWLGPGQNNCHELESGRALGWKQRPNL